MSMMALRKDLILRSPRSGRLEGRTMLVQVVRGPQCRLSMSQGVLPSGRGGMRSRSVIGTPAS